MTTSGCDLRPPILTARQEEVAAQLYEDHAWSALLIAEAVGVGRRAVENALRRQGVQVRKGGREPIAPSLPLATGRAWLLDVEQRHTPSLRPPTSKTLADGRVVFRKRRCQHCQQLNSYVTQCGRCGEPLDHISDQQHELIAEIYTKEVRREPAL